MAESGHGSEREPVFVVGCVTCSLLDMSLVLLHH